MTKKKRELIEILLDNVKPEDWPESFPYAAQDKSCSMVYVYTNVPDISSIYDDRWECGEFSFKGINIQVELCKHWNKTIVHRDEFMKRWNERSVEVEAKTPQQLALEKFGTDWHENDGSCPVCDDVIIEVMHENGVKSDQQDKASEWLWGQLTGGWTISKWRIHSDEKEPQASEKEKKLEWLSQPMPLFGEEIPCRFVDAATPLSTQIGGDHYTKLAIQPMQYSMKNGLDPLQHTIIKYVTRFRDKAGIEDLEKAKHCIDMLIEYEYPDEKI